jgi:hypothetical protein
VEILIHHLIWTTAIMTVVAVALVVSVVRIVHWVFPEGPSRTPMATAFVSIIVAAIFGVALNNLFAMRRDRDTREWNMRQQHLAQLRPVLKSESDRFVSLAGEIRLQGFLQGEHGGIRTNESEISTYMNPDVMSFDLANHYSDYAESKNKLTASLLNHDRKFDQAVQTAQAELRIHDISWFTAQTLATSYVAHCAGRGPGLTVQIAPDGRGFFSFEMLGQSHGGSEQVAPDLLDVYRRYRVFRPTTALQETCQSLGKSADDIQHNAAELSKTALLLEQETALKGSCRFLKVN